ncbi:MAG: hypothetical protein J5846_09310 [Desulfovibrio sp.]|nr:hypothetical protein [Desulfovibrio sp.]
MAAQSMIIDSAKSKIDHFVLNDENIKAYNLAEEAEKIRKAEIDFARKNSQEQTAIDMIKDKKPLDEIIKYSRLSPERIAEIKATLQ